MRTPQKYANTCPLMNYFAKVDSNPHLMPFWGVFVHVCFSTAITYSIIHGGGQPCCCSLLQASQGGHRVVAHIIAEGTACRSRRYFLFVCGMYTFGILEANRRAYCPIFVPIGLHYEVQGLAWVSMAPRGAYLTHLTEPQSAEIFCMSSCQPDSHSPMTSALKVKSQGHNKFRQEGDFPYTLHYEAMEDIFFCL